MKLYPWTLTTLTLLALGSAFESKALEHSDAEQRDSSMVFQSDDNKVSVAVHLSEKLANPNYLAPGAPTVCRGIDLRGRFLLDGSESNKSKTYLEMKPTSLNEPIMDCGHSDTCVKVNRYADGLEAWEVKFTGASVLFSDKAERRLQLAELFTAKSGTKPLTLMLVERQGRCTMAVIDPDTLDREYAIIWKTNRYGDLFFGGDTLDSQNEAGWLRRAE